MEYQIVTDNYNGFGSPMSPLVVPYLDTGTLQYAYFSGICRDICSQRCKESCKVFRAAMKYCANTSPHPGGDICRNVAAPEHIYCPACRIAMGGYLRYTPAAPKNAYLSTRSY